MRISPTRIDRIAFGEQQKFRLSLIFVFYLTINTTAITPQRPPSTYRKPTESHRVDERITAPEVKLVGEGLIPSVYPTAVALQMAQAQGLNLVEMSGKTDPPVCKILDYKKFKYEQSKKAKQIKGNKIIVKEVSFTLQTHEHDLQVKLNHIRRFLTQGATVKGFIQLKGREVYEPQTQKRAQEMVQKIVQAVEPYGTYKEPTKIPKKDGPERRVFFSLEPGKQRAKVTKDE